MENRQILPNISVDCVIFGYEGDKLQVLLRKENIEYNGETLHKYKLPGNHIYYDERIEDTASRILKEQTGAENIFMKQFKVFADLDRLERCEADYQWIKRERGDARVLTIGFYALIKLTEKKAMRLMDVAQWIPINEVHDLIFDHADIIKAALEQLQFDIEVHPLVFELLPKKFTLSQLQTLYELILNRTFDKRNFRRKIAANMPYIISLEEKQKNVCHKPAVLYGFDKRCYNKLKKERLK